ncbi:protein NOI4 isoform X1 [Elaeis guineensis]|uniref:Protein NOI4 n=1 Tax=Elaeis guineensis var. tenera TaxID=51953 RepID=A0A8N4F5I8_ELAGV|nr:protein NOI4 [Elaeis guineensis]XP_029121564.1 protein NOI4 [Elaeis guineensis]
MTSGWENVGRDRRIVVSESSEKGRPLPKFGDWDVNNPASAEGFTVIFNKARDEKKTSGNPGVANSPRRNNMGGLKPDETYQYPRKSKKWFCCG